MAWISSKAAGGLENKKKYNGIEFDSDLDLNIYEAFYRDLDPQTARFLQIDPKIEGQETVSPYSSMANNPILKSDPLGDDPDDGPGPKDPPGLLSRIWNSITDFTSEMGYRAKVNIGKDIDWVKSAANTLAENAKANWGSGNTVIQQTANDFLANPVTFIEGEGEGKMALRLLGFEVKETELVQRAMSKDELKATENTGLIRGGREGTHHVSDAIGNDAKKVRQRLALDNTPKVKVTMEVPKGIFSTPTKIKPTETMPGGGLERTATGNIPAKVVKVKILKNTGE